MLMKANEYISMIKEKALIFVTLIYCKLQMVDSLNYAEYCIQIKPFTDYAYSKYLASVNMFDKLSQMY